MCLINISHVGTAVDHVTGVHCTPTCIQRNAGAGVLFAIGFASPLRRTATTAGRVGLGDRQEMTERMEFIADIRMLRSKIESACRPALRGLQCIRQ
ncbi:hypothetical protein [Xanthomonas arboricola]|uniref:hypothetical protein n=1 Tax=Xanthomonas arboricola TaxID=56448 RepID=UPI0012901767|nr:hypothetical protein [Xanthomonas arboricola]